MCNRRFTDGWFVVYLIGLSLLVITGIVAASFGLAYLIVF